MRETQSVVKLIRLAQRSVSAALSWHGGSVKAGSCVVAKSAGNAESLSFAFSPAKATSLTVSTQFEPRYRGAKVS